MPKIKQSLALAAAQRCNALELGEMKRFCLPLTRFSHHFFEAGFEHTDNLDGGPLEMHAGLKKRLWTIAHDHGPVFRPSPS
jgi:hypothetical protein